MQISELCKKAHQNAHDKGFWDSTYESIAFLKDEASVGIISAVDQAFMSQKLMLIVSELGEALEALRKGDNENFEEEIADVFIRLGDFCGGYEIDIEKVIKWKMGVNEQRPLLHNKKF